jgi:hypothetical protein
VALQLDASEVLSLCKELAFIDDLVVAEDRQKALFSAHVAVAESILFSSVDQASRLYESWNVLGKACSFLEDVHARHEDVPPAWCSEAEQQVCWE